LQSGGHWWGWPPLPVATPTSGRPIAMGQPREDCPHTSILLMPYRPTGVATKALKGETLYGHRQSTGADYLNIVKILPHQRHQAL